MKRDWKEFLELPPKTDFQKMGIPGKLVWEDGRYQKMMECGHQQFVHLVWHPHFDGSPWLVGSIHWAHNLECLRQTLEHSTVSPEAKQSSQPPTELLPAIGCDTFERIADHAKSGTRLNASICWINGNEYRSWSRIDGEEREKTFRLVSQPRRTICIDRLSYQFLGGQDSSEPPFIITITPSPHYLDIVG